MKITGEYKQCPTCRRPYERKGYPKGTTLSTNWQRGVGYLITPHEPDCRWAATVDE